jgi:hypothetical protein
MGISLERPKFWVEFSLDLMRRYLILVAIGLSLALANNTLASERPRTAEEKRAWYYDSFLGETYDGTYRVAARIKSGKPVNEFEAYVLCSAYFFAYISGCGGANLPKLHGDKWIADSVVGYAGSHGPKVIVDRNTGVTYSPGREVVKDPKVYMKFIQKRSNKSLQPTAGRSNE